MWFLRSVFKVVHHQEHFLVHHQEHFLVHHQEHFQEELCVVVV